MSRHTFIDNSNIFGGAQKAALTLEPTAVWCAVRVYYRNLFSLLEEGDEGGVRVLAGSVPPGNEALWEHARKHGYNTDLLHRVERDDGRLQEQAVDEILHLKMMNAVVDYPAPQTLVIASGDGRHSIFGTSFPGQAARALRMGWSVEVWSWRDQLTGRYAPLATQYPGKVKLRHLDDFYSKITFIKAGTYVIDGESVTLAGRIVAALPQTGQPQASQNAMA